MKDTTEWMNLSWAGAGAHNGHTVRPVEVWEPRVDVDIVTCGRVECSCGTQWDVGGWPPNHYFVLTQEDDQ